MARTDGAEQQGLHRGNFGCGSDRTPGRHAGRHRGHGCGRCRDVPGARGGAHSARAGHDRGDPGCAPADAHGEGTGMTTAPELTGVITNDNWLAERSWSRPSWTIAEREAAKAGGTVAVVRPALNEEQTVASVVASIEPMLGGLVDELVVLDSGSTDDTAIRALTAGARVVSREEGGPGLPTQPGKGGARWGSRAATSGGLLRFVGP